MNLAPDDFSRIDKLFVDRDGTGLDEIQKQRANYRIALVCGPEVAQSSTLQAAVLTAANVGTRCFPRGISFHLSDSIQETDFRLPWSEMNSISTALKYVAPAITEGNHCIPEDVDLKIIFGNRPDCNDGLQVTYDGWVAAVGPKTEMERLPERNMCTIAGVTCGALAISEAFLNFANITVEASRRCIGISLWRPDLAWHNPDSIGLPVQFLPSEFWLLGLGHLGQAYLWTLSMLSFKSPEQVNIVLQDFDKIIPANMDTGLLTVSMNN